MKRIRHILNIAVWTIFGSYIALAILLHVPAIQRYTGKCVANLLEDKFGTTVNIGNIDLGFFNRLIIDDFNMTDKKGKDMLKASRLSVSLDIPELANGKIVISSAQIFGLKANLYKENEKAQPNYQFVIDSLSSKDKSETKLDLRINSFIIRNGAIKYDRLDIPYSQTKFSLAHININKISTFISIRQITNDAIEGDVKRLSFAEVSGLELNNLSFHLSANSKHTQIKNLNIKLPNTNLNISSIEASYNLKGGKLSTNEMTSKGALNGKICVSDFSFINKEILSNSPTYLYLHLGYTLSDGLLNVKRMSIHTSDNDFKVNATASITPFATRKSWTISLNDLHIGEKTMAKGATVMTALKISMPKQLQQLKDIDISGKAQGRDKSIQASINAKTNLGTINATAKRVNNAFSIKAIASDLNLKDILQDEKFGNLSAKVSSEGTLKNGSIAIIKAKGEASSFQYNRYTYKDATFNVVYNGNNANGNIYIKDPNITATISGKVNDIKNKFITSLSANIENFNPQKLNLTNKWGNASFSTKLTAAAIGKRANEITGQLAIKDFLFASSAKRYSISSLSASVKPNEIMVDADFGKIQLYGKYNFSTIKESLLGIISDKIKTLPRITEKPHHADNDFNLSAELYDTQWLETLLGIPFHSDSTIHIFTAINDKRRSIKANVSLPDFSYAGGRYKNGALNIDTKDGAIFTQLSIKKSLKANESLDLHVNAKAANDKVDSKIDFVYDTPNDIKGSLLTQTSFYKDPHGNNTIRLELQPSAISVKDTLWNVKPSSVIYNSEKIQINQFAIGHERQHIKIDGIATRSEADSIFVDLSDVDVNYILDLVDFHSVTFSGKASGKAYLKSVLNNPEAYANLMVRDFKFQDGKMGTLDANVRWNKTDKQIDIDATAKETDDKQTIIKGYVSPARNYIDLGITAKNTNIEFLKSFCGSFMSDINARATGFAQVYGDLNEVNLRGDLVANGNLRISTLNTLYTLKNDTIHMVPDEIEFRGDTVWDERGNYAIIDGALHHKHLTRLTYDLDIFANNFLCYDFKSYGNSTFFGTVYGTGSCSIKGRPHNITFDIDMTPNKGSFIEYNASDPDAITSQNFISWVNHNDDEKGIANEDSKTLEQSKNNQTVLNLNDASDIRINFNVNTTPDFALRVLMDKVSGDKITLYGNGAIKANYFNKGSFDMFGTYLIDHGSYNLTIQNIIKKDFQFEQGSSIVFGGNPFNALLNLKAVYPVNGVSLADLKIGNSFSSNNVRVDCIMKIGGTPESINVDFDFDMPTVNNDAKQMVRSIINSEEELNQQVVYLLAIGRFYVDNKNNSNQEDAQQSQTSLAMQSLLSGTISQQINSILGSLIKDNNWNFGTNISTGTEGFNNAEYEGLLSGSLFSNRLLINGQFGYRDNPNTTSSFIGDFDLKYLLTPSGSVAIKVYNQTNDRYFTKSSINTQGLGLILKRDFNSFADMFGRKKKVKIKKK